MALFTKYHCRKWLFEFYLQKLSFYELWYPLAQCISIATWPDTVADLRDAFLWCGAWFADAKWKSHANRIVAVRAF